MKILKKLWEKDSFRKTIYIFIAVKLLILAAGYGGYFLLPSDASSKKPITDNELLNPWAQYDGRAYLDIAVNGYNPNFNEAGNYGFYPLYPLLIRLFSFMGADLAAFLLANLFSLLTVIMLYIIAEEEFGDKIAKKATTYLILFPTAYFLSVMYAESLFIFLSITTFFFARRGNWLLAGIAGFFTALTRMQGAILFFPVAYLYLKSKQFNLRKIGPDALFLLLIPAGTATYMIYLYAITGDILIWTKSFAANGKQMSAPWTTLYHEVSNFIATTELKAKIYITFNFAITGLLIASCYLARKKMKAEYTIYMALSTLLPLMSGSLEAISRYALSIFPMFILLPLLEDENGKLKTAMKIILAISVIILIVLTIRHVNMHLDPYGL